MKLISCEIFYREMCAAVARSQNRVDIEFLPKGLHDIGTAGMHERLQTALQQVDETNYDAVLFGYGICNNGVVGLQARSIPIVVPRAHDCITLFLGSKQRYLDYFDAHTGVYFKSTGWIERNDRGELRQLSIQEQSGMDMSYEEMVAKYGEDNAKFLYEQLGDRTRNYGQLTFIEMGIEPDDSFEQHTRDEVREKGWEFEKVQGDLSLIQRFVDGQWDDAEFLVVPPGARVVSSYDETIITLEKDAS
ncbi:MAG: DUF1638 domain-containing protein [Pirellulaceae bacterium]|nr:DUF1638 domain-containing protein [Pirellulaceae bacterium]HJN08140.1 DUF1638 domain-containing protein [Pirellulaceae bacterium]